MRTLLDNNRLSISSGDNAALEIKDILKDGKEIAHAMDITIKNNFSGLISLNELEAKGAPIYSFISGMFYTDRESFDLGERPELSYPYTSYYKFRIENIKEKGKIYRSLIYAKLPLMVMQFSDYYISIEFEPVIRTSEGKEIIPFVSFERKKGKTSISFAIANDVRVREKNNIWLGAGEPKMQTYSFMKGEKLRLLFKIKVMKGLWYDSVNGFFDKKINNVRLESGVVKETMKNLKTALFRAWDEKCGTFGQLPWKETPGFALDKYTFGLLSYEAVNLLYFYEYWLKNKDSDYFYWTKRLRSLLLNKNMQMKPKKGRGKIWYELTNCDGKELSGNFYMHTGYAGYPGGQATIALNLLNYFFLKKQKERICDKEILKAAKDSLEYIISTQNENGSWPAAIKQKMEPKIRLTNFEEHETTGGTAECLRALLTGYKIFKKKKYLKHALKALEYLKPKQEKGYACFGFNTLRDIGIDEVEGISAVYAINAFLDACEILGKREYLDNAMIWSSYLLSWVYWWSTEKIKFKGYFHPISQSITPRISPYESLMVVSLYLRLFKFTKKQFWKNMALFTYKKVLDLVEKDGGMCECYFPNFIDSLGTIPMEQTFATSELLKASMEISNLKKIKLEREKKQSDVKKGETLGYEIRDDSFLVFKDNKLIADFDYRDFKFRKIFDILDERGMEISFYKPYSKFNRQRMNVKNKFKKDWKNILISVFDFKNLLRGVEGPKKIESIKLGKFSKQEKNRYGILVLGKNPLKIRMYTETDLHRIESDITFVFSKNKLNIVFNPFVVRILDCSLKCFQVLFPAVGFKKSGISILGNKYNNVLKENGLLAYDISMMTNWTNHGIYRDSFTITADRK